MSGGIESATGEQLSDDQHTQNRWASDADSKPSPNIGNNIVGIPAYNEEHTIASTVLAAKQYADEVIVVDDGSSDETAARARQAGAMVLEHETNRGKGGGIKTIFEYVQAIDYTVLVLLDGDGQHRPNDIPEVAGPILTEDADIVIGSRYLDDTTQDETPRYRRFGQRILDTLTLGSTGMRLSDTQSGFRAFSPAAIKNLPLQSDGMGVETEMIDTAAEKDLKIREVPIDVRYEGIDGQTYHPLRHGLIVVSFVFRLIQERHPLIFFGIPGIILTATGIIYGLEVLAGSPTNISTAGILASGFITILGVLSGFSGLILHYILQRITEHAEVDTT